VKFVRSAILDVIVVELDVHYGDRGYFDETYHADRYEAGGIRERFVQDNQSRSVAGTIRRRQRQREGMETRATFAALTSLK